MKKIIILIFVIFLSSCTVVNHDTFKKRDFGELAVRVERDHFDKHFILTDEVILLRGGQKVMISWTTREYVIMPMFTSREVSIYRYDRGYYVRLNELHYDVAVELEAKYEY